MNLRPLIDDVAAQAADLVLPPRDRAGTRAALADFVALEYPFLASSDRRLIVLHVLALLDDDDFFAECFVDSFAAAGEAEDD
ncbi:MAG: hypothetical protein EAZ36_00480, partial [Verrucomicrobia bacterium]